MLFLYRFMIGFLHVKISGDNLEEVLNAAARERIFFWDLHYKKREIIGKISVADFRRLRSCKRGRGTRIHIIKKCGLPFLIHRYRLRFGMFSGIALFMALIYILSMFIWSVEVTGNKNIEKTVVLNACKQLGIEVGTFKKNIDPKVDSQKLMLKVDGIAWASLNIEGSVLTVNISEIKDTKQEKGEPDNFVAAADGIIKKIDLTSGNAVVKVGDAVKKGDLLVSGVVEKLSGTEFVPCEGFVFAETIHTINVSGKYEQEKYMRTGKVRKHSVLSVFGMNIPLYIGKITGDYESEIISKKAKICGRELPIGITTKKCYMTSKQNLKFSEEELLKQLDEKIKKEIEKMGIKDYSVVDKRIEHNIDGILVSIDIKSVENVAIKGKILVGSGN